MNDFARRNALNEICRQLNEDLKRAGSGDYQITTPIFDRYTIKAELIGYSRTWLKYNLAVLNNQIKERDF